MLGLLAQYWQLFCLLLIVFALSFYIIVVPAIRDSLDESKRRFDE